MLYRFKMAAKLSIFISHYFDFGKNLINHFPKGILFNEIWLKVLARFKMAAKLSIFISRHFDFGQNLKNHFPKGSLFNEI